jgi:hypothetical protein
MNVNIAGGGIAPADKRQQNQQSIDIDNDTNVVPFNSVEEAGEPCHEPCLDCNDAKERWQWSLVGRWK